MKDVAVVVPVYNEVAVVGDVLADLRTVFPLIVCVDDGSVDGSGLVAEGSGAAVIRHAVNLGQGAALQTGFEYVLAHTDAAYAITFDSDGQYLVSDAAAMVEYARERGLDVVLGSRNLGDAPGQPMSRRALMRAALAFSRRTSGLALTDTHNGLRVLNRRALAAMNLRHRGMAHASEIENRVHSAGLDWAEFPVTMTYTDYTRAKGQSNLNAFNIVYELLAERLGVMV